MIALGEGWVVENGQFIHACGPEVRGPLCNGGACCDCGARVPRRVRLFRAWLVRTFRPIERLQLARPPENGVTDPSAQRCLEEPLASLRHQRGELADAKSGASSLLPSVRGRSSARARKRFAGSGRLLQDETTGPSAESRSPEQGSRAAFRPSAFDCVGRLLPPFQRWAALP
jgi:hypothetical protein